MQRLCTNGLGFITTNICKPKHMTIQKGHFPWMGKRPFFSCVTGFPPITSFLYFTLPGSSKTKA